jgi:predicted Zn-dependent protease
LSRAQSSAEPRLRATDAVEREAAAVRLRLEEAPTNPDIYLQLARLYRRAGKLEPAHAALREGLSATGQAFELIIEQADLEIEPFRRNLAVTEEKLAEEPDDPDLRRIRVQLRKEINTRELEMYRLKADRHPAELSHRYEVGVRLMRAGQLDEAIRELQAARGDTRVRWQCQAYLGHCFKARSNWKLAARNFEEALENLPDSESNLRKDLLYELACALAEVGDLGHAVDVGNELAHLDYGYRDIGELLDEWQERQAS